MIVLLLLLIYFPLMANEEPQEEKKESLLKTYWSYHPLHVGVNGIALTSASLEPQHSDNSIGDLTFNKFNSFATILIPFNRSNYIFPRVEWNTFEMKWNKNPKFKETRFNYWQFALTFYSIAIEKWRWIIRADYNLDAKHFSQPGSYGLFSSLFWGAYQIHRKWHYHIGALGYAGLQGDEIYPVIGLDFAPNKKWFFQCVFPIIYTVDYNWGRWRFSLKGRPLHERFRVDSDEPQANSIFSYSTMGAEANIHYEIPRKFEFEVYGGYNFGGSFYIKDRAGRKGLYTNVQGAPYVGATLDYGF